jgi:transcriptional repressor NrdR
MVETIEQELAESTEREIYSKVVGEKIIQALKQVDDVAYVRFASVYREFKDVADFIQELKGLLPKECQPVEFEHLIESVADKADERS